jgi:putative FmdB family regulatory protein
MPTYDYECEACGHEFEKFQSMTAPAIRKCPECGKLKVRRLIGTGAGVIFKGSGFYQTDYRSDSYKKAAQKDKPSDSKTSEGSSDSKTSETSSSSKASTKSSASSDTSA